MLIYIKLIWAYFKISIFGFGGGYAMLSLIRHEIVGNGWISEHTFTDIVAISQMTPGPIGINTATYIGYTATGGSILGSVVTTLAVILPSFLLVFYAIRFVQHHQDSLILKNIFASLRPVVVGLIGSAALVLMNKENFDELYSSIAICCGAFVMSFWLNIHPIIIVILSAIVGYLIYGL